MNRVRARQLLADGDLRTLFIEELGWDRHSTTLEVIVGGSVLALQPLAQKRGMIAYQFGTPLGQRLPDYAQRRKIEHQVARSAHEHLIVFTDSANETQIWQWVKREPAKPAACREHTFHRSQPGDALLQKLEAVAFSLEEEDRLSLTDVTRRTRAGFDVERITKRFYERFQKEHAAFLKFITGITESTDREWYASLMLNRLMFVYFVQRKGFLDSDRDYLRNRLSRTRAEHGKDKFHSFYRYFLLRLFHEGLGGRKRTGELEKLVGRIPYLNGGLFDVHELERSDRYGKTIQIPDQAFERIFDYFDQYQWHLDERPLRADNEINPDVLGYIFEKYINQKQMGAYYSKEDITEYISKNTVLPFLFDSARAKCEIAFENPKGPTVWDLLKNDPDRYIYPAVRHGGEEALPPEIAEGLNPETLHKAVGDGPIKTLRLRNGWNNPAPATHALPAETWREVVTRRKRNDEIKAKLASSQVRAINDLITLNLDVRQFAQDAIENCEGPDLLRAFWHAIERVTILDPACGSGAFLFAALNILEPLYEACLDRMQIFLDDMARSTEKHRSPKLSDFHQVLAAVAGHPNRRYFILKSIILNSLFGVDIMEEAVEICKLRLFLKLAAQVNPDPNHENLGIEPLPDIDFNIRAGNTLVGYTTLDAAKESIISKFDFENAADKIATKAGELQHVFDAFRSQQIEGSGSSPTDVKQEMQQRLTALNNELNGYLAAQYDVAVSKKNAFATWLKSHQPFHWLVEFHGIVSGDGFDVVLGNPPYVEWAKVSGYRPPSGQYTTMGCGNLYTAICERSYELMGARGRFGMIVPISCVATERMKPLRDLWARRGLQTHVSHYSGDAHPSVLFDGVKFRLSILLQAKGVDQPTRFSTHFQRWLPEGRDSLFHLVQYTEFDAALVKLGLWPKISSSTHKRILATICRQQATLASATSGASRYEVYCHRIVAHFVKAFDFVPYFRSERDGVKRSEDYKIFGVSSEDEKDALAALLNSTLFYQWFVTYSDVYHCGREIILVFPADLAGLTKSCGEALRLCYTSLGRDFRKHSVRRRIPYQRTGIVEYDEFYPRLSKALIDKIDNVLAKYFKLTEDELDFIINYDIKFRIGQEGAEQGDEAYVPPLELKS